MSCRPLMKYWLSVGVQVRVGDDDQRAIAIAKLEGLTKPEIAKRMNRALRTIERKLQLIRAVWEQAELK